MNLVIKHLSNFGYYLYIEGKYHSSDEIIITKSLSIGLSSYIEILTQHGAHWQDDNDCVFCSEGYYFKNIEDAQQVINTLEPYLIMESLVE